MNVRIIENTNIIQPLESRASQLKVANVSLETRLHHQLKKRGITFVKKGVYPVLEISDAVFVSDFLLSYVFDYCKKNNTESLSFTLNQSKLLPVTSNDITYCANKPIEMRYLVSESLAIKEHKVPIEDEIFVPIPLSENVFRLSSPRILIPRVYGIHIQSWSDLLIASSLACRDIAIKGLDGIRNVLPINFTNKLASSSFVASKINKIGKNCKIHSTAVIESSIIGDNVEIGPHSYIRSSIISDNVCIREHSSIKLTFVGKNTSIMPCDTFNSYVGESCTVFTQMLLNTVFYDNSFIGGASGFSDFEPGRNNIEIQVGDQKIESNQPFVGSAVGANCFIGAGIVFKPGRTIPPRSTIFNPTMIDYVPNKPDGYYIVKGNKLLTIPKHLIKN